MCTVVPRRVSSRQARPSFTRDSVVCRGAERGPVSRGGRATAERPATDARARIQQALARERERRRQRAKEEEGERTVRRGERETERARARAFSAAFRPVSCRSALSVCSAERSGGRANRGRLCLALRHAVRRQAEPRRRRRLSLCRAAHTFASLCRGSRGTSEAQEGLSRIEGEDPRNSSGIVRRIVLEAGTKDRGGGGGGGGGGGDAAQGRDNVNNHRRGPPRHLAAGLAARPAKPLPRPCPTGARSHVDTGRRGCGECELSLRMYRASRG